MAAVTDARAGFNAERFPFCSTESQIPPSPKSSNPVLDVSQDNGSHADNASSASGSGDRPR